MANKQAAAERAARTRRENQKLKRWEEAGFPDTFEGATMISGLGAHYREEVEKIKAARPESAESEAKSRLLRADDFIAESLEGRAARMPEGIDREHTLRMATLFRNSGRTGKVRVWEK